MAQNERPVNLSASKIRKAHPEDPKRFSTSGSAWVLELPCDMVRAYLQATTPCSEMPRKQTFLATTNQVVTNTDVTTKTFSLRNVPLHDVRVGGQIDDETSLIFIPTEPLQKQRRCWRLRTDEFQLDRAQLCHRRKESEHRREDEPGRFYCYVLCEAVGNDKSAFRLQRYVLETDKRTDINGSYFLQAIGSEAKLRKLEDFDITANPMGSIILNENNDAVGFLAFRENGKELYPLLLPQNIQERSSGDGQGSEESGKESTDTEAERDANRNKEDIQVLKTLLEQVKVNQDDPQIRVPSSSGVEDSYEEPNKNVPIVGKRSDPTEYGAVTGQGVYREEKTHLRDCRGGANQRPSTPLRPPIQRSQSEATMTPRSQRKVARSFSERPRPSPLKSGDLVENAIHHHPYAMDSLKRGLDPSYNKNIENWQHWAYRREVSDDKIMQLKSQSPESHSEALFRNLAAVDPDLSIQALRHRLTGLIGMNNVIKCIQDLKLKAQTKVSEVLESGKIPGRFFAYLDQKPEDIWNKFGEKLGFDHQTLKIIRVGCLTRHQNPAEEVIEMLCAAQPMMPISQFRMHLDSIDRKDVSDKLDYLSAYYRTITHLRDDLNLMREVTCLLNDTTQIKTFKDLAKECGIAPEIYHSLEPPCNESPTKEVLEDIVGRNPRYTVNDLFIDLHNMNRLDVVEAIGRHFIEEDMRTLMTQLQIPYE